MTALIENGLIKEDELGSTLLADGDTVAYADVSYFKPDFAVRWENDLGTSDFTSTMTLVFTGEQGSGALFALNSLDSGFQFYEDITGDNDFIPHPVGPLCKACLPDVMLLVRDASAADN